jgi:hypothetical protein
MKLRYGLVALVTVLLLLSACEDNIPMKTSGGDTGSVQDQSNDTQKNIDKKIEKERDKMKQYMNDDVNEVIEHQNKAMETFKKAQRMDTDKEQYEIFVNETLPEAKKALAEAKALKHDSNPKDLDQLEDKLIQPLHTFVSMLEYRVDALKATSEQKKKQLEETFEQHAKQYVEEMKAYYEKLDSIAKKYNLDINLDNLKRLKEQIEQTIEIAGLLHHTGENLKQLAIFQDEALNALQQLVENDSKPVNDKVEKWKENLLPQLDSFFDKDDGKEIDWKQLDESIDQLKKATKAKLDALETRKEGIDKNDSELIEQSREKYKVYEKELDDFHSNLEDAKSKIDQLKKQDE